jgi:hypothetical protein
MIAACCYTTVLAVLRILRPSRTTGPCFHGRRRLLYDSCDPALSLRTHRGAFAPMSQLLPPRSAKDSDDEDSDDDVGGTAHDDGLSPVNPDQRKKVRCLL